MALVRNSPLAFRSNRQAPKELVQLVDDFVTQRLVPPLPVALKKKRQRERLAVQMHKKSSARGRGLFTIPGSSGRLMLLVNVNVGERWYVGDILIRLGYIRNVARETMSFQKGDSLPTTSFSFLI